MDDEQERRFRRRVRWGLWAAIAFNFLNPFLLWSLLGHPPVGFGASNFSAAIMGLLVDRYVVGPREREHNGR